jgi:hypothetical protein
MEGVPYFPEYTPDDDPETSTEKKDKKDSKDKKLSIFEKPKTEKNPEQLKDDKSEKKETEKEVPLEKLADDEKQTVVEQYVEARTDEVKQELSETTDDTPEEAAVLANAALLENIQEKIDESEPVTEELLDEAVAETIDELGLELPDIDSEEIADDTPEDDDVAAATTPTAKPVVVPPVPTPTTPPPTPPIPPVGAPPVATSSHPTPPVAKSAPATPNVLVVPDLRRERTNLLVGGILGYLIGRRRGRIKTEKKLLPVQEKLQKEVVGLHDQIALREEQIRKLAREQVTVKPIIQEKIVEKLQQKHEAKQGSKKHPEKLGKFAVLAERPGLKSPENQKPVDLMTLPELLAIAGSIKTEQSTVQRMYETSRLNEEGLRRIIRAYLRGERYELVIHDNLLSPEIYREPVEQNAAQQNSSSDIKQVINDPGTGSNFALPALNSSRPNNDETFLPDYRTKKKVTKTVAIVSVVAATLLIVLLSTR